MTAPPRVSICVVAYRDRENLLRCLASVREHGEISHETIVVDDASGDGSVPEVRRRFPEVTVIQRAANGGLVAGRNDAIGALSGEYVLMLDSDTELRTGALAAMTAVLDSDPSVGLVGPRLVGPDGALQHSCRRYPPFLIPLLRRGPYARFNPSPRAHRRHMMFDFDHVQQRPVVWVSGAAQMWRRALLAVIGPYDTRLSSYGGEDLDWCLRVWGAGRAVHYVPEAEVMHRWQQVTRRDLYSASSRRAFRDWYYLQFKHRRLRRHPRLAQANQ